MTTGVADRFRQGLTLLFAAGQVILPLALFAQGFNTDKASVGQVPDPNPATPAGYAFAVWGVIYLGAAAFAVVQALPSQKENPVFRATGWWIAGGFLLCCVWLLAARFGPVVATVPVIFAMLLVLGRAFILARNWPGGVTRLQWLTLVLPLGIYVGWLSAAAFVNAADVLPAYGFNRLGLSAEGYGLVTILMSSAVALFFAVKTRGFLPYVATVVWALTAIIAANGGVSLSDRTSVCAALACLVLVAVTVAVKLRPSVTKVSLFE
jgi:hypothetical protein